MPRLVPQSPPAAGICLLLLALSSNAFAQYRQAELPLEQLPQEHEYQRQLRDFLGTLKEQDFAVPRQELVVAPSASLEDDYRLWLLSLHLPNVTSATLPAASFTLPAIESQKGLVLPCAPYECQMLAWLAGWDYPGNPFRDSRPLMLRAAVLAAVDMVMLDYLYEHDPQGADRADYLGGNLIWLGTTYKVIWKSLPENATAAFDQGLKKQVLRLNQWGPKGLMTDMDLFAPVGLWYIAETTSDPEVKDVAEKYSRRLFAEPQFFHPAGYFVDNGCFDTSYNGISLYFATWAALASNWRFTQEAVQQAFRLRAHLCFPDPDGSFSGPSAMSSRTSADPPHDQWNFPHRPYASAMVADESIHLAPLPKEETIKAAPARVIALLNAQLGKPRDANPQPWRESHWSGVINFAHEHYRKGYLEQRLRLEQENSPLLKPLYQREGAFDAEFAGAFSIVKRPGYAAAIHTGPVGIAFGHLGRPYGYGGGQISAFWTASTGAVILGRRRGVQGAVFDSYDEWRLWPIHAVTGVNADGEIISSCRIIQPNVSRKDSHRIYVTGNLPKLNVTGKTTMTTDMEYERRFELADSGVIVRTKLKSKGKEKLSEFYETIPIFLRENGNQKPAAISFLIGDQWAGATPELQMKVKAVKIQRFAGAVQITFCRPVRARLAPQVWQDGFQTRAECRTLLVDLIKTDARPAKVRSASVEYTIAPAP